MSDFGLADFLQGRRPNLQEERRRFDETQLMPRSYVDPAAPPGWLSWLFGDDPYGRVMTQSGTLRDIRRNDANPYTPTLEQTLDRRPRLNADREYLNRLNR